MFVATRLVFLLLLTAWVALALHYSNLPWGWARSGLAVAFVAFAVWALWVSRRRWTRWAYAGVCGFVAAWFALISPSQHREWRPEVATTPRAFIDGERIRITGVRNFHYRTIDDFDPRYEERTFDRSRVVSMDLFISYWTPGPVAHTFVSFNFDDGSPPLCISIETRTEVGEAFQPVASMFKQFELIYVVGDERDLVGSRAAHREEQVYRYTIQARPEAVRMILDQYLSSINALADEPAWYHLMRNSCTVNIVRNARAAGWVTQLGSRLLLNGWVDRYLHKEELIDSSAPFELVRERARITDLARAAENAPDFSSRIRQPPALPQ
jgi:hypothetical protein